MKTPHLKSYYEGLLSFPFPFTLSWYLVIRDGNLSGIRTLKLLKTLLKSRSHIHTLSLGISEKHILMGHKKFTDKSCRPKVRQTNNRFARCLQCLYIAWKRANKGAKTPSVTCGAGETTWTENRFYFSVYEETNHALFMALIPSLLHKNI